MVQFLVYFPLKHLSACAVTHWVFSSGHGDIPLRSRQAPSEHGNLKFLQINLHKPTWLQLRTSRTSFPVWKLGHELCI